MIPLQPLGRRSLQGIFTQHYAKYLSQHDPSRFYLINYLDNGQFLTQTHQKNKLLGTGWGTYNFLGSGVSCRLNIRYEEVFPSPNARSPMHPENPFYPELRDYQIGPFYAALPRGPYTWLPVLYNQIQGDLGFKVLNFYKRGPTKDYETLV